MKVLRSHHHCFPGVLSPLHMMEVVWHRTAVRPPIGMSPEHRGYECSGGGGGHGSPTGNLLLSQPHSLLQWDVSWTPGASSL